MYNIVKHLATIASGGLICYGIMGLFTIGTNYLALPSIIIGLVWYAANNSKALGLE